MASAASSLYSISECHITENISCNVTASRAYQQLLVVVISTQLNFQNQNLSDMIYFILFKLKA